jgi:hypothetical protein
MTGKEVPMGWEICSDDKEKRRSDLNAPARIGQIMELRYFCASTTAIAAISTISLTSSVRCNT